MENPDQDSSAEVLLTRAQAARRIGVSLATVRRMEGAELTPILIDGKHMFRVDEVDRFSNADEGQVAARAFELFEAGRHQVQVVIALGLLPERVAKLHAQWVQMSARVVCDAPSAALVRFLREELGADLVPAAVLAALRMLYVDPELRRPWVAAAREAAQR